MTSQGLRLNRSLGTPHGRSADVSDFRKVGLNRQFLNFRALETGVAISCFMQLYKCHRTFGFRQPIPPTDALRKRAGAIHMIISDERGLNVPCDIRHSKHLAWSTRCLSSLFLERAFQNKGLSSIVFPVACQALLGRLDLLGDAHKCEGCP